MEASGRSVPIVRFGAFEFDVRSGELWKGGHKTKLQQQPFRLLAAMLERPSQVVTREELRSKLWPADMHLDFEHSLTKAVNKLREVLQDSAENPRFIETLRGCGYRFIGPVERRVRARPHPAEPERRKIRLAVLPFRNLSGDPQQDYFSDGVTEEMILHLGQLYPQQLGVIASTSVMQYKRTNKGIREIARQLDVDYILEGSVRTANNRARITAQLVQAEDQFDLWAKSYERELTDVLTIQNDVAEEVARSLALELLPSHPPPPTAPIPLGALEAYLKGRDFWNKRSEESLKKGIQCFEQAIQRHPHYALAYAGLADCYLACTTWGYLAPREVFPKLKDAARKALQIDASLAEAHAALGMAIFNYDWDWPAAEREFQRAIELNPNYAAARQWYAWALIPLGRIQESLAEMRRAQELDPLSPIMRARMGVVLLYADQPDEAIQLCRNVIELAPDFFPTHTVLGLAYQQKRRFEEAIAELEMAAVLSEGGAMVSALLAHAYAVSGRTADAEKTLEELDELSRRKYVSPYSVAVVYAGLGREDQALQWLEKAWECRDNGLIWLRVDRRCSGLRLERRFQDLLGRLGLQPQGSVAKV